MLKPRTLLLSLLTMVLLSLTVSLAFAQVYVGGYYRSNGTYVQPHYRSLPDGNPFNNYSTRGNINPYTGSYGTRNPYSTRPRSFYTYPY